MEGMRRMINPNIAKVENAAGDKIKMKRTKWIIIIIAMSTIVLAAGYFLLFFKSGEHPAESNLLKENPVAKVQVVPIKKETIMETVTAYGTVAPAPGSAETFSVLFESRVRHISVIEGQKVSKGDVLLEIDPSPDAKLLMEEARRAYTSASQKLKKVQERFNLKLATREELLTAEDTLQQTRERLKNLEQSGVGKIRQIRSTGSGIVYKVHVNKGSVIPGNSPFLEIVPQDRIEVHLNVEQDDIERLRLGQPVLLSSVNISQAHDVTGKIRTISQSVNPVTRLVNIFVSLPISHEFFLGGYVRGQIVIASKKTLVVPRTAVLPEDGHYVLFIVQNGRALKRIVNIGLENHTRIEVVDKGLNLGDLVVNIGNYELQDGMAVQAEVLK
jgi:membrane fusion protein (multidrug efflux system)